MIIHSKKFIPHPLAYFSQVRVFPSPLPEMFYTKICKEYEEIVDAVTSRIIYKSDDLEVTGISCFPTQTENEKHPILIYNRGGNREYGSLTVLSVMRSMLPFAREGYLVYASNYRGNDGGEGEDEFGGGDVNDVFNLLEIAKNNPAWDRKNIFILGHSRGGMMTYMMLRKNKTITAAISIAGVADLEKAGIARPEMIEKVYRQTIPDYDKNPKQALLSRSAIYWADEIETPILLLHGTADEAVDLSNSQKLAEKLSEYNKRHELVIYENGNHALLRHWDNVLEKSKNWCENYKK